MKRITQIFAHRGAMGTHPENTMAAFKESHRVGADGIELDVQLSRDGVPVVIHDETVDRTSNGTGWVKDLTWSELRQLDFGAPYADSFAGERIPSLEEVLSWIAHTPLTLNIELKNGIVRYPGLEDKVITLVQQYGLEGKVIVSSFNHYSLVDVKQRYPHIETAILFMEGLYEPWRYAREIGASGLHCLLPVAVPEFLQAAAAAGMPVRPFNVNREEDVVRLMQGGCDAIFTNWPERARELREQFAR